MKYVVAIDVGGTDIKSALVDENLKIHQESSMPTPKSLNRGEKIVELAIGIVADYQRGHQVLALGLAFPGVFDDHLGICRWSENLALEDFPVKDLIAKKLDIPVIAKQDVRTAALAEISAREATECKNAIFIPIGTGIGAAIILNSQIYTSNGYEGEIGHLNVGGAYPCLCGKSGCLEAASSAQAISRAYAQANNGSTASTQEIAILAKNGDALASKVWDEAMAALARGCEMLITILAPEIIIFGGGLSNADQMLIDPLSKNLDDLLTFQKKPKIEVARYGSKAGLIGSALIAFQSL